MSQYRLGIHIKYMYNICLGITNTSECLFVNSVGTKLTILFKTFQTYFCGVDTSWWFNCIHQLSRSCVTPLHCQHCKTWNWSLSVLRCDWWLLTSDVSGQCQWQGSLHTTDITTLTPRMSRTGTAFLTQRLRAYLRGTRGLSHEMCEPCLMEIIRLITLWNA